MRCSYTRTYSIDMNTSSDIATRLDQAMRDPRWPKAWSQYRLSKVSGVPQATIRRILKGNMPQGPEVGTLRALAECLGVSFAGLSEGIRVESGGADVAAVSGNKVLWMQAKTTSAAAEEMPRAVPMVMSGPHFLTPQEWLLVSIYRRVDARAQQDLLGYADDLPKVINPPIASNQPQ